MSQPKENLENVVLLAKQQVEAWQRRLSQEGSEIDINWAYAFWNVKPIAVSRDTQGKTANLLFTRYDDDDIRDSSRRTPLPDWFIDLTKAFAVYLLEDRKLDFGKAKTYLITLRRLHLILEKSNVKCPTALLRSHLEGALRNFRQDDQKKLESMVEGEDKEKFRRQLLNARYVEGCNLEVFAQWIDSHHITMVPLRFKNPHAAPARIKTDKRPTPALIDQLAKCINEPLSDDERILMETIRLHFGKGDRINETLFVPVVCPDGQGPLIKIPREGKPGEYNYGLRYYPEKGFEKGIATKPLDTQSGQLCEMAINALLALTAPMRERAKLLEDNPGRAPIPKPGENQGFYELDDILTLDQVLEIFCLEASDVSRVAGREHHKTPNTQYARNALKSRLGIEPIQEPNQTEIRSKGLKAYEYRVCDIEAGLLKLQTNLTPLVHKDTRQPILRLSNCLCLRFEGQFTFEGNKAGKTNRLVPRRINDDDISGALGDGTRWSIFERRRILDADGKQIKIFTHGARHLKNTFLDEAGLTNLQQALIMGRKNFNAPYQHSPAEKTQESHLTLLKRSTQEEQVEIFKQGVRTRLIEGDITATYHEIRVHDPVAAEEFLEQEAAQVLITRYGICKNNWATSPCPKHNRCFKKCTHYHVSGSDEEIAELEAELNLHQEHRELILQEANEGAYKADQALAENAELIEGIEHSLKLARQARENRERMARSKQVFGDIAVVQVFPDGQSNFRPIDAVASNEGDQEGAA